MMSLYLEILEVCKIRFSTWYSTDLKSWILKKQYRRNINAFKCLCWKRLLRILWPVKKTNQWIIKQRIQSSHVRHKWKAQIILFQTYNVRILIFREDSNFWKGRRKEKQRMTSNKVYGLSYSGNEFTIREVEISD